MYKSSLDEYHKESKLRAKLKSSVILRDSPSCHAFTVIVMSALYSAIASSMKRHDLWPRDIQCFNVLVYNRKYMLVRNKYRMKNLIRRVIRAYQHSLQLVLFIILKNIKDQSQWHIQRSLNASFLSVMRLSTKQDNRSIEMENYTKTE